MDSRIKAAISGIISDLMNRVMNKVLEQDPFIPEQHRAAKPIYAALVPDEIFKGSHFERRFVTPFGSVWEKLAVVVAKERHGDCQQGLNIEGTIRRERLRRIQETLNNLEHPGNDGERIAPHWERELKYILEGGGEAIPATVTCDLFVNSEVTKKKYSFELKGPLPNSDQTKVSKEKMFKLLCMEPKQVDAAFYALPYNPYGAKQDYAWSFPLRWFDMANDSSVLIGNEFWELIGGKGTYEAFISTINSLGEEYRERIYREYLEIEPPEHSTVQVLR
ncbi:MAG: TdeIII family type II restriction endonuclease [Clostridiales Family XIII bacterium]|jgi:hypothetical protein|nr:TdeIII family type II restriction endonuclease [Clostridiales Family XIII bacterium]